MHNHFHRPENGLKLAIDLDAVGKKDRALDVLSDLIKSKKHRTWHKIHEQIMEKFVTLCVELKKSHAAKEGLYQYKNICQHVNIKSLDNVMTMYLKLAEERTENARKQSHLHVVESDDLDDLLAPEKLLLSAVSGEDSQDRNDRAILTPWLKFMWESFRQCLDLLRNNPLLEKLYKEVAVKALSFCLRFSRKTEFRKLCENLRTHLGHIHKNQNQQRSINLSNIESQSLHLEIRLAQLECAIQMELWQEAFKAVEDIHSLIVISKKAPKPSLLANYYQKLALVLQKSGNGLFHACALYRLFHLSKEQKKHITEAELKTLASRVVCSTLAIPLSKYQNDHIIDVEDGGVEKQKKLASLLNFSALPTRKSLLRDILKHSIIQYAYPELNDLYNLLEVDFQPMDLPAKVKVCLEFLRTKEELAPYIPVIQDVTITKFIKQISQVFQTITFSHLNSMIPFTNKFHMERVIVDAAKNIGLQVRVDHAENHISFSGNVDASQEDTFDGHESFGLPSEQLKNQMASMSMALQTSITVICPDIIRAAREAMRQQVVQGYLHSADSGHRHMLKRRQKIEDMKEEMENMNNERERQEQEQVEEQKRRQYETEMARLSREAEEREKQRKIEEHRDIQKKVVKERLEQIKSSTVGAKAFADLTEEALANMDMDDILAKQVEQLEKEKKEKEEKLKAQEKKVDYFERAKCLEAIPLLVEKSEKDKIANKVYWDDKERERIDEQINERNLSVENKERLRRTEADQLKFVAEIEEARSSIHRELMEEFNRLLAVERERLLLERKEKRKEERRVNWLKEKEEREIRKREEEIRRKKDEEDRINQAKKEQEEQMYKEKLIKLAEIEEKKKLRELEIEERKKQKEIEDEKRKEDMAKPKEKPMPIRRDDPPKEDSWRRKAPVDDRDAPRYREDRDAPRYKEDRDAPRYKEDRDAPRYKEDRDAPRYKEDRDAPRYKEDRDAPRHKEDRDAPRYREDRDVPRFRDDRRGYREDKDDKRQFSGRSYGDDKPRWNPPRNEDVKKDEGSWRRDDGPKKTENSWRRRDDLVKKEDSWRSPSSRTNPAPPAKIEKEESKPKPQRKPDDDDGWKTVRH